MYGSTQNQNTYLLGRLGNNLGQTLGTHLHHDPHRCGLYPTLPPTGSTFSVCSPHTSATPCVATLLSGSRTRTAATSVKLCLGPQVSSTKYCDLRHGPRESSIVGASGLCRGNRRAPEALPGMHPRKKIVEFIFLKC
jgi:hypothetical protein